MTRNLRRRINAVTGIKSTTSLTSVVDALRALGNQAPGDRDILPPGHRRLLGRCFEQSGFSVAGIRGMGLKRSIDMGKVMPDETYRFARAVATDTVGADGILISCGNLRTFEAIEPLEADTGLPVVTSNQAGLWQALRLAGVQERLPNLGKLLRVF